MERVMSVEEKIKRAEEIYNRRNGNNYKYKTNYNEKKKVSLIHRMIKQIIICLIIYGLFYVTTNKEYFLSYEFQSTVEQIASKNDFVYSIYGAIKQYIEKYINDSENKLEEDQKDQKQTDENKENDGQTEENKNEEDNIGGSFEEINNEGEKTQEEKDAEDIKKTISFINPVDGKISSTFGWRSPTTASVPKYHTGLDIATPTGTIIKSATDGKVTLVSSEGDYGKHYRIKINDVTIIYAHCSKLYLNEGDEVTQGQDIAEVGSTGNSTGPHLHFEIRKQDRLVDPQLILDI